MLKNHHTIPDHVFKSHNTTEQFLNPNINQGGTLCQLQSNIIMRPLRTMGVNTRQLRLWSHTEDKTMPYDAKNT